MYAVDVVDQSMEQVLVGNKCLGDLSFQSELPVMHEYLDSLSNIFSDRNNCQV